MNIYVPKIIYVYNETLKKEYTQNEGFIHL